MDNRSARTQRNKVGTRRRHRGGHHDSVDPFAPAGAAALTITHASAAYTGAQRDVLDDISVEVGAGLCVALVGPNGAGKSTLLKAVAGLLPLRAGSIRVFGLPLEACRHRVAYLPQRGEIDWRFPISVRRLVLSGRFVHLGWLQRTARYDSRIADHALEQIGLAELAGRQIGQLSGGQQQRVLLARVLAQAAELLLLDEPLNAVDARTHEAIGRVLDGLRRAGSTVLVATHDLHRLQSDFDSAICLEGGRVVQAPGDERAVSLK